MSIRAKTTGFQRHKAGIFLRNFVAAVVDPGTNIGDIIKWTWWTCYKDGREIKFGRKATPEEIESVIIYAFCRTKKRDSDGYFHGLIIKWDNEKRDWVLVKSKRGKTKWRIVDWTYMMYCDEADIDFRSLHRPKRHTKEQKEKLVERMHMARSKRKNIKRVIVCPYCSIEEERDDVSPIITCGSCNRMFRNRA